MKKHLLYYHTIKYLKPIQVRYQLYNRIKKYLKFKRKTKEEYNNFDIIKADLETSIQSYKSYFGHNEFEFLNQKQEFNHKIDWDFDGYGKLWTYNLNYFEYLHQEDFEIKDGLVLINKFIDDFENNKTGKEPFPTSLRIINWIKFLLNKHIQDKKINESLFEQSFLLYDNIEYHLQGNHLLENAFALLFAGIYFNNKKLVSKGEEILTIQLDEQILSDGAHFELSPMYHQLMFYRLLDVLNLARNSKYNNQDILSLLTRKAGAMYSWLENISLSNEEIPLFNDSSIGIAPTTDSLIRYAKRLNIFKTDKELGESGYRKFKGKNYELIVDIGKIGPDYIPGHGHNDMLSFVLYIDNKPIIVDTGTSIYGGNPERRNHERLTQSHNTVSIEGYEQAEVWGDFRVARRSFPVVILDEKNKLIVEYTHFSKKYKHRREFTIEDNIIEIVDTMTPNLISISNLHFDDSVVLKKSKKIIGFSNGQIDVENGKINQKDILISKGFNNLVASKKVEIEFENYLNICINIY